VNVDLRQDYPYAAYGDLDVRAVLPDQHLGETHGDVYDRIVVRLLEVGQSCRIIRQCLSEMPAGPFTAEEKPARILAICKKASGEGIGRVEAPAASVSTTSGWRGRTRLRPGRSRHRPIPT